MNATAVGKLPPIDFERIAASVDLPALLGREGIEVSRAGMASCPFHVGKGQGRSTPSLSVFKADGRWRWKCHGDGCGKAGDAIAWVAEREGISTVEAARKLGGVEDYRSRPSGSAPASLPDRPEVPETWADPDWQVAVDALVVEASDRLWRPEGRDALDWLRSRGLADVTIARFKLGFVATPSRSGPIEVLEDGRGPAGVYAPRGIAIPWLAPGACFSDAGADLSGGPRWVGLNVRRLADPDVFAGLPEGVAKCLAVRGSRRGFLYPWPEILPTQGQLPLLLAEGEFDALIGVQELGHVLHVATAGSASVRSLPLATRSALALSTWVLLALDHDRAGVEGVWEWRERYPAKSRRVLLPSGKDLNEFHRMGGDLRSWIADEIRLASTR